MFLKYSWNYEIKAKIIIQVPARGPIVWVVSLTILQGTCGMAFGLVISALCDTENDAIQLALGSFYPNLLLSGIIWPLEGMPKELRFVSLPDNFNRGATMLGL